MQKQLLMNYMQSQTFSISLDLIRNREALGIKDHHLILIIYLINQNNPILYDAEAIGKKLNMNNLLVLNGIHELQEAKILKVDIIVNKNNKSEEYLNIEPLYEKLSFILQQNIETSNDINLYEVFESEFGRPLSPMEYEIINSWLSSKISNELIIAALKEATFNGVSNLRYIDKILFEWQKAGFKKLGDIKKQKPKIKKEELFDYNWLEE